MSNLAIYEKRDTVASLPEKIDQRDLQELSQDVSQISSFQFSILMQNALDKASLTLHEIGRDKKVFDTKMEDEIFSRYQDQANSMMKTMYAVGLAAFTSLAFNGAAHRPGVEEMIKETLKAAAGMAPKGGEIYQQYAAADQTIQKGAISRDEGKKQELTQNIRSLQDTIDRLMQKKEQIEASERDAMRSI